MPLLDPSNLDITALPSLPLGERRMLPNISAIYFVLSDAGNQPIYIGKSKALRDRWLCHNKAHYFHDTDTKIAWIVIEKLEDLIPSEKACIRHWKPRFNRRDVRVMSHGTKQTSVRIAPELLRLAKYYLDRDNSNLQEFLSEQLERYVAQRHQAQHAQATPHATAIS